MFPMEDYSGLLLTAWCFVYDLKTRVLKYASAGHHPSFLVAPDEAEPQPLWLRGPTIGMLPSATWSVGEATIAPGSRLYIFSDGCFEIIDANGQHGASRTFAASSRPDRRPTSASPAALSGGARRGPPGDPRRRLLSAGRALRLIR